MFNIYFVKFEKGIFSTQRCGSNTIDRYHIWYFGRWLINAFSRGWQVLYI